MPPPRLPRHLRPCLPPGLAHHVRVGLSSAASPRTASSATIAGARGEHALGHDVQSEQGPPLYTIRKHPEQLEAARDEQLMGQIRTLQAALEGRIVSEKPSPPSPRSNAPTADPESTPPSVNRASQGDAHADKSERQSKSPYEIVLKRAWGRFRSSTRTLIYAAIDLRDVSPQMAAPIRSSILRRLQVIAGDAAAEEDILTAGQARKYPGGLKSLIAEMSSLDTQRSTAHVHENGFPSLGTNPNRAQHSPFVVVRRKNSLPSRGTKPKRAQRSSPAVHRPVVRLRKIPDELTTRKVYSGALEAASLGTDLHADTRRLKRESYAEIREESVTNGSSEGNSNPEKKKPEESNDSQTLTRHIHTQSRAMDSSDHTDHIKTNTPTVNSPAAIYSPPQSLPQTNEVSEQSLLEELFPEVADPPQSHQSENRVQYPKLDLPEVGPVRFQESRESPKRMSRREEVVRSFQEKGEKITVLQLAHCSTELMEADFRRLIPKGKHIESWRRDGEFYKIIPGRDPISLERLPFYYILFRDPQSALAYQKNASRLHKLSALHQPSDIFSAIPPPTGFLEDGEDLNKAISLYNLIPRQHHLNLSTLMQPYNPALRALLERGGYQPIMPNVDSKGEKIWKVLMHIEGYEPTPSDLFKIFRRDAWKHGMSLSLRNESSKSIHRLRDIINLKTKDRPISSIHPGAYGTFDHDSGKLAANTEYEDPGIRSLMAGVEQDVTAKEVNQVVMNRVYNRWVIEFSEEEAATRFAHAWHRRLLPDVWKGSWKDWEEARMCNTEVLW